MVVVVVVVVVVEVVVVAGLEVVVPLKITLSLGSTRIKVLDSSSLIW